MSHTTASIPVDLKSPGQVLACMGFVEAAEVLLGGVEAHFDWSKAQTTFVLRANGDANPFEVVLEFLAKARIVELTPIGYVEGGAADGDDNEEEEDAVDDTEDSPESVTDDAGTEQGRTTTDGFPSAAGVRNSLPVTVEHGGFRLSLSHWADGSSREDFKLYSGNRSASRIATQMLLGVRGKPKRGVSGDAKNRGLRQLWQEERDRLLSSPFQVLTPMGGSFNFDPRGAWTAIDAGYSPNTQKHGIASSPVVEILAAVGLENARPGTFETRKVHYTIWGHPLPPMLMRAALGGANIKVPTRRFKFELGLSGKNKVITFAQEEVQT